MISLSASQDELHTSHCCGELSTQFGTTLHRARKIPSQTETSDVSSAVMTAERRATHTGDPLLAGGHFRAVTLVQVIRGLSFKSLRSSCTNLCESAQWATGRSSRVSQTADVGTELGVLENELTRTIPAEELVALREAISHVSAFGPVLTKPYNRTTHSPKP